MANQSEGQRWASERNTEMRKGWAKREEYWNTDESRKSAREAQDRFRTVFDDLDESQWERG